MAAPPSSNHSTSSSISSSLAKACVGPNGATTRRRWCPRKASHSAWPRARWTRRVPPTRTSSWPLRTPPASTGNECSRFKSKWKTLSDSRTKPSRRPTTVSRSSRSGESRPSTTPTTTTPRWPTLLASRRPTPTSKWSLRIQKEAHSSRWRAHMTTASRGTRSKCKARVSRRRSGGKEHQRAVVRISAP